MDNDTHSGPSDSKRSAKSSFSGLPMDLSARLVIMGGFPPLEVPKRCLKERPVPGMPTLAVVPRDEKLMLAPRTPAERDTPLPLRFKLSPGKILIRLLKRKPIAFKVVA